MNAHHHHKLENVDDLFLSLMAVATPAQLTYFHHIVVCQMKARGMMVMESPSRPDLPAHTPQESGKEVQDESEDKGDAKWNKVSNKVKAPPTKEQKEAARRAKLQKPAGPFWDSTEKTEYYLCCTNEHCDGRVYVSFRDVHEDYDSDDDDSQETARKYVAKTLADMQKTMDNTGLFVHGLAPSDEYEEGRSEVLSALKGVVPKSTRVKPGDEFGFIYFDNHLKAVKAQRLLIDAGYKANFLRRPSASKE